jgi:hypothetical protein
MFKPHGKEVWPQVVEELREFGNSNLPRRPPHGNPARFAQQLIRNAVGENPSDDTAPGPQRHLLFLQLALINLTGFALLGAAYHQGWIFAVVEADGTGMSIAIFGVFVGGLSICVYKVWRIAAELNAAVNFDPVRKSWASSYLKEVAGRDASSRAIAATSCRMAIADRIIIVRYIANSLVLLGLIGTVLGFIIALSAVDPSAAGDVQAIEPMVTQLIQGMSVALYTTLVGAVLNLWLSINYRLLASGGVKLVAEITALGEARARYAHD